MYRRHVHASSGGALTVVGDMFTLAVLNKIIGPDTGIKDLSASISNLNLITTLHLYLSSNNNMDSQI